MFFGAKAQDTIQIDSVKFTLQKQIENQYTNFTTDYLGFIYLWKDDKMMKLNSDGKELFRQSFKNMGDISMVDATQSLRTLLYYRDLTQLVFLDNSLSVQGESIKLEKEGFPFVTLACASFMNNHFWIYSTDEFMVKRLDKQLNEQATSVNIALLTGKELNPDFICEAGDYLFLHDPALGILQFDLFGTYIQTIPDIKTLNFQMEDDKIMYLDNGNLMIYSLKDFSLAKLDLPIENCKQFRKWENKLFLSVEKQLSIYLLEKR